MYFRVHKFIFINRKFYEECIQSGEIFAFKGLQYQVVVSKLIHSLSVAVQ
jgi:hypothetical protein